MFKWVKLHFIPTEENAYQPHFLRLRIALALLLMMLLLEGAYLFGTTIILPRSDGFAAIFATVLIEQTNKERNSGDLSTLTPNAKLEAAAKLKAEDMATKGYFAHNTPDGKTPWYWFEKAGYDYAAAGENLAVNFTDSKDVTEAWMRSPSHRANILSGNYTEIGIATARGTYKGKEAIFVVQEFGRPSLIARQIDGTTSTAKALTALISGSMNDASPAKPKIAPTLKPLSPKPIVVSTPPVRSTTTATTLRGVPTTTTVAGADTQKIHMADSSFAETSIAPIEETALRTQTRPTKAQMLIASPHRTTNTIYLFLAGILLLALGLAVFVKIRVQHPHIIANGVLLLAIIGSMVILNSALGLTQGVI